MRGEIDVLDKTSKQTSRQTNEQTSRQNSEQECALAHLVCAVVSIEFGVQTNQIITLTKGPAHLCFARQVAMYLMHVVYQIRLAAIARAFGRDPSTVSHACRCIEEARDDLALDVKLTALEDFLDAPALMRTIGDAS